MKKDLMEMYVIHRVPIPFFIVVMVCSGLLFGGMFPKDHGPPIEVVFLVVATIFYLFGRFIWRANEHVVELYANRLVHKKGFWVRPFDYQNLGQIVLQPRPNSKLLELFVVDKKGKQFWIESLKADSNLPNRLSQISGIELTNRLL